MSKKSPEECFWAYLLLCADGTFYAGSTNDLVKRLHQHNHSGSGAHYTKIRRPVTLAYSEKCLSYSEMRKREAVLKRMKRSEKEALVHSCLLSQKEKMTLRPKAEKRFSKGK